MEELVAIDDYDLEKQNAQWDPTEWIGCHKTFRDVPDFVAVEAIRALRVPPEIQACLPAKSLSPSEFYTSWALPAWDPCLDSEDTVSVDAIGFDATSPMDIPSDPAEIPLLPLPVITRLHNMFGQSWFDGKKSIRDARIAGCIRYYPLWFVSYAGDVRIAARSLYYWSCVMEWILKDREDEEPQEAMWRERALQFLSSIPGSTGQVGCKLLDLTYENLAEVLGDNQLTGSVLDALMHDIGRRIKREMASSTATIIADSFFATCVASGVATEPDSCGYENIARISYLLKSSLKPTLIFPAHSPPCHWLACRVDIPNAQIQFGDGFHQSVPKTLSKELTAWLKTTTGTSNLVISNDLPCGIQRDVVNCGIIAVNALAHSLLGDPLWEYSLARTHRYQAFCTIADLILTYDDEKTMPPPPAIEPAGLSNVDVEIASSTSSIPATPLSDDDVGHLLESFTDSQTPAPEVPSKRARESEVADENDTELLPPKRQKPGFEGGKTRSKSKLTSQATTVDSTSKPSKKASSQDWRLKIPREIQLDIMEVLRKGGQSKTARHDRLVGVLLRHGLYVASEARLKALRMACMDDGRGDPNPGIDPKNPKQVTCSRCNITVQLQAVYQAQRFLDHWNNPKSCKKRPKPVPNKSIETFFKKPGTTVIARRVQPQPAEFTKPCPGLTGAIHPRIDYYIEHCPATGAGAKEIGYYVKTLFGNRGIESIRDVRLTKRDRETAYTLQSVNRRWRIETSAIRAAVLSTKCHLTFIVRSKSELDDTTVVCESCWEVYLLHEFRTAINRNRDKPHAKLKCTPKIYTNPIQSRIMARYHGLEEFLAERSELSPFARFAIAVGEGKYKNNKVFLGLVETMQLATERHIRGVGMQNFKYPMEFREWGALLFMTSPRAYRNMAQEFRMETSRSIQHRTSQRPRFPIGITSDIFPYLDAYCKSYDYPASYPLCISVDDTKLLPAMHPLYDGPQKTWYLIGLPGQKQLQVSTPEELERLMSQNHSPATKLRLWAASIPFPGIPPLALAILPISSKMKASELAVHQIAVMNGLVDRQYRFISNVADGAAVERDCQARVAAKSTRTNHLIRPPPHLFDTPSLSVPLYNFRGNIFINTQDAPHARKTGRNNIFSGARGLILGNFPVYYKQLRDLAIGVDDPPLYERDVIRADRQDDRAALRVFSAATLHKLTENIEDSMGLLVLLFIIGELIDAYESRSMSHASRAKAVMRARVFFMTWKLFLNKQGYSITRYYISSAADKIYEMLVDGLLGLILIHRDHLTPATIPLLPWKHESMGNERIFAALRDLFPDMSLAQAMFALPHIRVTMAAAKKALFSKAGLKASACGYSFSDISDDQSIDFSNLAKFPTDEELTVLYGEAIEENHMLWSLLDVNIYTLSGAPTVPVLAAPVDQSTSPEHLTEDEFISTEAEIVDLCIRDELQEALSAVQNVAGLLRSEEQEIDACAYAAAALVVDNLARIDNLPAFEDPEQLELCRQDIACVIKSTPKTVESLLTGLQSSFGGSSMALTRDPSPPPSVFDITPSELYPLVQIRERNQTEDARRGVRSFIPGSAQARQANTASEFVTPEAVQAKKKKSAEPTQKQILAQRIQAVIREANSRKATTGLNRKARTEQAELDSLSTAAISKPSGNAANAAAAAEVRATTATRRRENVFKDLICKSDVSGAGIAPLRPLGEDDFIFVVEKQDILLARVITLYSKGAGKGGKHDYVSSVDTIGRISYVLVQTYAHSAGRMFQRLHSGSTALGISRFAHLPAGSVLFRVPDKVTLKTNVVEVSSAMALKYKEFEKEQKGLVRGVTTLNTVKRRGGPNINIVDFEVEEDVDS